MTGKLTGNKSHIGFCFYRVCELAIFRRADQLIDRFSFLFREIFPYIVFIDCKSSIMPGYSLLRTYVYTFRFSPVNLFILFSNTILVEYISHPPPKESTSFRDLLRKGLHIRQNPHHPRKQAQFLYQTGICHNRQHNNPQTKAFETC